jgi:hypothetical protein
MRGAIGMMFLIALIAALWYGIGYVFKRKTLRRRVWGPVLLTLAAVVTIIIINYLEII